MVFLQTAPLSGFLAGAASTLDRIVDFGPFLIIGVGLFLIGLAVTLAVYDSWWTSRKTGAAVTQQGHTQPVSCLRSPCPSQGAGQPAQ
jgi:hypothetical protein